MNAGGRVVIAGIVMCCSACATHHGNAAGTCECREFQLTSYSVELCLPKPYVVSQEENDDEGKFIVISFPDSVSVLLKQHPLLEIEGIDRFLYQQSKSDSISISWPVLVGDYYWLKRDVEDVSLYCMAPSPENVEKYAPIIYNAVVEKNLSRYKSD